jgi:hypothetical protein
MDANPPNDDMNQPEAPQPLPTPESTLADELRSTGLHLAAALRAAASTPEAQEVRADLREGIRNLRSELDEALSKTPVETLKSKGPVPRSALRAELANALRSANKVLDRLAASMESDKGEDRPSDPRGPEAGG